MESSGDAFDTFFQAILGGASGSQYSAAPSLGSCPPRAPSGKGKSQGTSHSGSRGTPRPKKRKFGLVSAFSEELRVGDLDLASNKDVSHLARCFYYSAESVTPDITEETDKMSLIQCYGQALRATQEPLPSEPRLPCHCPVGGGQVKG